MLAAKTITDALSVCPLLVSGRPGANCTKEETETGTL